MRLRVAPREEATPWGLMTNLNLYRCNPKSIRDSAKIKQYVVELCELIGMQRFGECQVVHFGRDERVEGYSMVQFIETSLISGHFANLTNAAYIDVFSCKPYDPDQLAQFSEAYFEAEAIDVRFVERM